MAVLHHIPEGFQTYGNSVIGYMDENDIVHLDVSAPVVMLRLDPGTATTEEINEKLSALASEEACTPGTIAFMPGWGDAWQRTPYDTWQQFISSGE